MGLNCRIIKNPQTGKVENVEAPNGAQSLLYSDALETTGNEQEALDLWATSYIDEFKEIYGNSEFPTQDSNVFEKDGVKIAFKDRYNPFQKEYTGEIELE